MNDQKQLISSLGEEMTIRQKRTWTNSWQRAPSEGKMQPLR